MQILFRFAVNKDGQMSVASRPSSSHRRIHKLNLIKILVQSENLHFKFRINLAATNYELSALIMRHRCFFSNFVSHFKFAYPFGDSGSNSIEQITADILRFRFPEIFP